MSTTSADLPDSRVMAALDGPGRHHRVVRHDELDGPVYSAGDVARLLPIECDRIAKTLMVTDQDDHDRRALVVVPALSKVRFREAAGLLGWRRATLAPREDVTRVLGQPVFGVSPIGHPDLPVVVDSSLARAAPVLVGSGVPGVEIEMAPETLIEATGAICGEIACP